MPEINKVDEQPEQRIKAVPIELVSYKEELITILHKSQDAFEQQLSYISAGCLALSVGFIKDIIKDLQNADWKWALNIGWFFLAFTLLINLISHIRAADLHNKTISEINGGTYEPKVVTRRYKEIGYVNWISVGTLIIGISLIIIFVTKNIYNGK